MQVQQHAVIQHSKERTANTMIARIVRTKNWRTWSVAERCECVGARSTHCSNSIVRWGLLKHEEKQEVRGNVEQYDWVPKVDVSAGEERREWSVERKRWEGEERQKDGQNNEKIDTA